VKLAAGNPQAGQKLEDAGLLVAKRTLNSLFQKNYNILRMFNFALNPVASAARP